MSKKLAQWHLKTGEYVRNVDAVKNIKSGSYFIPPYHTPAQPDAELVDDEYHCFLDKNGNVPRDYKNGTWTVKKRFVKVTAYSKITLEQKEFDDESLVTDEYTLKQPTATQKWSNEKDDWIDDDEKIIAINQAQAKITRDTFINSNITLKNTDVQYQADAGSIENIKRTIELANTLGLAEDYSQGWKLADNTWRETTLEEIKQVHTQYLLRFKEAYELLAIWESGDMLTPFEIE